MKNSIKRMNRAASYIVALIAIILVIIASLTAVYIFSTHLASSGAGEVSKGAYRASALIKVEAVKAGVGYVTIYIRNLAATKISFDTVYLLDPVEHTLLQTIRLNEPMEVRPGEIKPVTIPLILLNTTNIPAFVEVRLGSSTGVIAYSNEPIELGPKAQEAAKKATIGLLAARDVSCILGDLRVDVNQIHWLYVNLLTGEYRFRYIAWSDVRDASGKAPVWSGVDFIDLGAYSWEERYNFGPVIVDINPTRATQDWTVTIKDIYGGIRSYTLRKLVDDPSLVALDAVVFWEDLWWPGTSAPLDNYIDHVVRITVFTNDTIRIEVLHASGCYLHMFIYGKTMPPFDEIPSIVAKYQNNNFRLSPDDGVVYVKSHGADTDSFNNKCIWDPVNGVWITQWPVVFKR